MSLLIALDYDDTYTKDPTGWNEVMFMMKSRGHRFVGCTMRYESEMDTVSPEYKRICNLVVPTGRQGKREFLANMNIHPNVWIDDMPDWIIMGVHNVEKEDS